MTNLKTGGYGPVRRIRLMGLCLVAILGLGALSASSAFAAETLNLKTSAGSVANGSEIAMTSTNFKIVTSAGTIECTSAVEKGTLTKNNVVKTAAEFTSLTTAGCKLGGEEVIVKKCGGKGGVTKTSLQVAIEEGTKGSKHLCISIEHITLKITCNYEAKTATSSFNLGGATVISNEGIVLKPFKKSSEGCATSATLSSTAALSSEGKSVETVAEGGGGGKKVLTLSTSAGPVANGGPIAAFSSNLIFETSAGNLECEENELKGTLTNNNSVKDNASITEEISKGNYLEIPGACKTSATGPVFIVSSQFPWKTEFTTKGTGKLKGTKKVAFDATFLALEGPNNHCTFEASKVLDTYNATTTKEPITITTTKQTFKHSKSAPNQTALCPASGVLSGMFSGSSGGKTLETQIK